MYFVARKYSFCSYTLTYKGVYPMSKSTANLRKYQILLFTSTVFRKVEFGPTGRETRVGASTKTLFTRLELNVSVPTPSPFEAGT